MELTTVYLKKSVGDTTIAKVYKEKDEESGALEILLPEFKLLTPGRFAKDELANILCKIGRHKEHLLILAQRECAVDL